jgi:hypothetical protein
MRLGNAMRLRSVMRLRNMVSKAERGETEFEKAERARWRLTRAGVIGYG